MTKESLEQKVNKAAKEVYDEEPEIVTPLPEMKGEQVELKGGGKGTPVDLHERVKVKVTNTTEPHLPPYHTDGEVVAMHPIVAKKFEANKWGKIVTILALFMCFAFGASAQGTAYQKLTKIVSQLPTSATYNILFDTVTNTGTNYIETGHIQTAGVAPNATITHIVNPSYSTTVQVNIHKISGTPAGTVTLQGSIDGVNWSAVVNPNYATSFASTATATNVTDQSFNWTLYGNPYRAYRVTWTGTGTMVATLAGFIWSH